MRALGERRARLPRLEEREVAVGFIDIVGFTRLSDHRPPREVAELTARLERLAASASIDRPPVRMVKLIGDGAMLIAPRPLPLVEASRRLVASAEAAGIPPLRAGLAGGPAAHRGGDWYGRTVNLASRISDVAEPGTVVAGEHVAGDTADRVDWIELPPRKLRGFDSALPLFRLRDRRGP